MYERSYTPFFFEERGRDKMPNASIGTIGKPYSDGINNRLKGFSTTLHRSVDSIEQELHAALVHLNGHGRVTLRTFVDNNVPLSEVRRLCMNGGPIAVRSEASIPAGVVGARIVYFGGNLPGRQSDLELAAEQRRLLDRVTGRGHEVRRLAQGFTLNSAWPGALWRDEVVGDLLKIYRGAFTGYLVPFTQESVRGMLRSNLVAVIKDQITGTVVAVAMAEIADIVLSTGQHLQIAEISEVATRRGYCGRGFARVLYQHLVRELRSHGVDLIYTEARANHAAILAAAYGAGLRPCGYLPQHCVISSTFREVEQPSEFGDLVVMALP